jgi:uncharacterized protein YuzE
VKVYYDKTVDAAYIELSTQSPEGVVEVEDGVNLDVTTDNQIVGIEILNASSRMAIKSLFKLEVDASADQSGLD